MNNALSVCNNIINYAISKVTYFKSQILVFPLFEGKCYSWFYEPHVCHMFMCIWILTCLPVFMTP